MNVVTANLIMGNHPRYVSLAAAVTRAFCEVVGLSVPESARLELAVVEAVNNIIEHACTHLPCADIHLVIGIEGETIVVELRDPGTALSGPPSFIMPEPLSESGRGWPLILAGIDRLDYQIVDGINVLTLFKRHSEAAAQPSPKTGDCGTDAPDHGQSPLKQ